MAEETQLKPCSFFLVRYVPDVVRGEGLNIGLFLYSPQEDYLDCLFTDDFRRVRSFHPQADVDLLRELPQHFEDEIRAREDQLADFVREMQESYSNMVQVTSPRSCLAVDPQSELQNLFSRYVGTRTAPELAQDTRMRIKQRLTNALQRHGVLEHVEKHIPAAQWTGAGDPFTFDYGYRPAEIGGKPNGHIKLIHAISLRRDRENESAYKLAHIMVNYVRKRERAELTAVVEALPGPGNETALHSQRILADAQIALQPIAGLDAYAQSIRHELGL